MWKNRTRTAKRASVHLALTAKEARVVNENNAYAAIKQAKFPGKWKRIHGARGFPDYIVYVPPPKKGLGVMVGRQFFVEVKEIDRHPEDFDKKFELELRPAQIPFFKDWPGEKYVLVRFKSNRCWAWFDGKERYVCLNDQIEGPFKRGS